MDLYLDSPEITIEQQQALLNIFNRRKMMDSGFCYLCIIVIIIIIIIIIIVVVVVGHKKCSIQMLAASKKSRGGNAVFKADTASKLVSRETIHDLIKREFGSMDPKSSDFRQAVKQRLENNYFCLTYSRQTQMIGEIDFSQNDQSSFELRVSGDGEKITYANYLKKVYGIDSPKKELFVMKDKTGKKICSFLPQHAQLTLRSDAIGDTYAEVLETTTMPIHDRLRRVDSLVTHIKKADEKRKNANKKGPTKKGDESSASEVDEKKVEKKDDLASLDFDIKLEPLVIKAVELNYPDIVYMRKDGKIVKDNILDLQWGKSGGGYLDKMVPLQRWAIVIDENDRYMESNIQNITRGCYSFIESRELPQKMLGEPDIIGINFKDTDSYSDVLKKKYQLVMLALPEGDLGSQYKAQFTRVLQSKEADERACLIQCLLGRNATNPNVIKGSLDDVMAKIGNVLFQIEPNLPNGDKFIDLKKTWCVGIELSHRAGKPTAVVLALTTAPLEGSLRSWHFATHLNPAKKDVISLEAACNLMTKALEMAVAEVGAKNLPANIIVLRGGMPDNRLRELYSKEVVGVVRALNTFKEKHSNNPAVKSWKSKLNFTSVAKVSWIDLDSLSLTTKVRIALVLLMSLLSFMMVSLLKGTVLLYFYF
ncbi:hypothetical protein RFI_10474 [Reticulomyxa filosa]|uniref:PAZ domain-containing protein n=1 Tax=Reticulomyxa filosa TaxID=46433 RepID=X6NK23_RETFI|nr:hypothetical protein RFI_10474 [Reticulomyxa filosa]|eukprot:ETO26660.1 hypothetical protein RFI_10474 [Reticulomyxa filosa]